MNQSFKQLKIAEFNILIYFLIRSTVILLSLCEYLGIGSNLHVYHEHIMITFHYQNNFVPLQGSACYKI